MKLFFCILFFLLGMFFPFAVICQKVPQESDITTKYQKDTPELGINFSDVSKLKIYLHKDMFRDEEVFTLDVALLTSESEYYYFPKYSDTLDVIIKDKQGGKIRIKPIFSSDRLMKFEKYKNDIIKYSEQYIVGCEGKAIKNWNQEFEAVDEDNPKDIFNRNLFWSIPNGCIDLKETSEVEIYAELSNSLVVRDKNNPSIKTAVGSIKSNTIKVKFVLN